MLKKITFFKEILSRGSTIPNAKYVWSIETTVNVDYVVYTITTDLPGAHIIGYELVGSIAPAGLLSGTYTPTGTTYDTLTSGTLTKSSSTTYFVKRINRLIDFNNSFYLRLFEPTSNDTLAISDTVESFYIDPMNITTSNATITTNDSWKLYEFTANSTFNITSLCDDPNGNYLEYLSVGGGGAGGWSNAVMYAGDTPSTSYGSGGGGGAQVNTGYINISNTSSGAITVGSAGNCEYSNIARVGGSSFISGLNTAPPAVSLEVANAPLSWSANILLGNSTGMTLPESNISLRTFGGSGGGNGFTGWPDGTPANIFAISTSSSNYYTNYPVGQDGSAYTSGSSGGTGLCFEKNDYYRYHLFFNSGPRSGFNWPSWGASPYQYGHSAAYGVNEQLYVNIAYNLVGFPTLNKLHFVGGGGSSTYGTEISTSWIYRADGLVANSSYQIYFRTLLYSGGAGNLGHDGLNPPGNLNGKLLNGTPLNNSDYKIHSGGRSLEYTDPRGMWDGYFSGGGHGGFGHCSQLTPQSATKYPNALGGYAGESGQGYGAGGGGGANGGPGIVRIRYLYKIRNLRIA